MESETHWRHIVTGEIIELDTGSFADVVNGTEKLVIVEFYTTSCPNCRTMEPVFQELAGEMAEYAVFARINAQVHHSIAQSHGVMGVPTFKFFCGGRPIAEDVGAQHATMLRNTIKDLVKRRTECIGKSTPISYEMDGYG